MSLKLAIDDLITKKLNSKHADRRAYCPAQYIKDYKTIQLDMGRGCGTTQYIVGSYQPGDFIIVDSHNRAREILHRITRDRTDFEKVHVIPILVASELVRTFPHNPFISSFKEYSVDRIFFDGWNQIDYETRYRLESVVSHLLSRDGLVIKLG